MFVKRTRIAEIYKSKEDFKDSTITVAGWIRTIRSNNKFGFIELNDGSCFKNLQIVFEAEKIAEYDKIEKQNVGASLVIEISWG